MGIEMKEEEAEMGVRFEGEAGPSASSGEERARSVRNFLSGRDGEPPAGKRGEVRGCRVEGSSSLILAALVKLLRIFLRICFQLTGYLFEAVMVVVTLFPALLDTSIAFVMACCGERQAVLEFPFTSAYTRWLRDTSSIAFDTEDTRRRRKVVKKAEKEARKRLFEKMVTNGILRAAVSGKSLDIGQLDSTNSIVFVFTDIEGSTQAQLKSPQGYQQAVLQHDSIMREALYGHRGLELDTEGDAFRLAFPSVVEAVSFCNQVQERLLQEAWKKAVLKIPTFKVQYDQADNTKLFAGPRVRMGVHLALPGTFEVRLNVVTQKPQITGPSYSAACALGDVGNGGQVLVSDEAWVSLQNDLALVGFPMVRHMGAYDLDGHAAMDIFEVTASEAPFLKRAALWPPLRRCKMLSKPKLFGVTKPPRGEVALVGLRASQYDVTRQASLTSFRVDATEEPRMVAIASSNEALLQSTIASVAQQFQGFMFVTETTEGGTSYIAFNSVGDACRFSIAIQATLLCADWPDEPRAQYLGQNLIYRGPTVGCFVHSADTEKEEFFQKVSFYEELSGTEDGKQVYEGSAVSAVERFVQEGKVSPGQIILSPKAWQEISCELGRLNQPYVIDLGVHKIPGFGTGQFTEILPRELKGRVFDDLKSSDCLAPGARMSPTCKEGLALVFTKIHLEEAVAGQRAKSAEEAIGVFQELTRQIICAKNEDLFYGYECQEVGAGNFMLAFRNLELAMNYASNIQEYMASYSWSKEVLDLFGERVDDKGNVLQRGPQVCLGIGFGHPYYSMPHPNTGRADYFGPIVNTVARVKQAAVPGQTLVCLKTAEDIKRHKTKFLVDKYAKRGFNLVPLGKHRLRGIAGKVSIAELCPQFFSHREPFGWSLESQRGGKEVIVDIASRVNRYQNKALSTLEVAENFFSPPSRK